MRELAQSINWNECSHCEHSFYSPDRSSASTVLELSTLGARFIRVLKPVMSQFDVCHA